MSQRITRIDANTSRSNEGFPVVVSLQRQPVVLSSLFTSIGVSRGCAPAAALQQIPPAKAIAPRLQLQPRLFRRSAGTRWSKVFPICKPAAAQAEVPKQDARSVRLQS